MNSDIKLTETEVHLEGYRTIARSADFSLDYLERRPNTDPKDLRLALVHNFGDSLVINWGGTYRGGVTIEGDVTIPSKIVTKDIKANTISADVKANNISAKYMTIGVKDFDMSGPEKLMEQDLGFYLGMLKASIDSLSNELGDLKKRLTALEKK